MLGTFLLVILILLLIGALPRWGYHGLGILSEWWDWAPTFDHHHLAAARLCLDAVI
jgi:hypothetical protein